MPDLHDPAQVTRALVDHLQQRVEGSHPRLVVPPRRAEEATSTWVWFMELAGLGDAMDGPVVLRAYGPGLDAPAAREHRLTAYLHSLGYPVPRPLLLGTLAGDPPHPFVLQSHAPGVAALDALAARPTGVFALVRDLAALQARLHLLPPGGFGPGAASGSSTAEAFLTDDLDRRWHRLGEPHDDRLRWLHATARDHPDTVQVICHGDFHPLNVLADPSGRPGTASADYHVLDWTDARIGDPHFDVARTLAILWLGGEVLGGAAATAFRMLRPWLRQLHRRTWEDATGVRLDPRRLCWWEVVHLHRGWLQLEEARVGAVAGPQSRTRDAMTDDLPGKLLARADRLRATLR